MKALLSSMYERVYFFHFSFLFISRTTGFDAVSVVTTTAEPLSSVPPVNFEGAVRVKDCIDLV